jgi:protein-arginine kinase
MTLQDEVEQCLEKYPETRNSDIELTIRIWREFHEDEFREILSKNIDKDVLDRFKAVMMELPREDNVKRYRAEIQNVQKRLVPTDEKIAIKRKFKVEEWQKLLGYRQERIEW